MVVIYIILLIVGFYVLIKGADVFVDGASNLARNFNVSKMLIGLTIVSFGTSAPELAVGIQSMTSGSGNLVVGNVIGSNILNVLLILGCASLVHNLKVKDSTVKRELPLTLLLTIALIIVMSDTLFGLDTNILTRGDALILLLFFSLFIFYLFSLMRRKIDVDEKEEKPYSLLKSITYTILGIIAIIIGSDLVVDGASYLASVMGVSDRVIALTIVALGTSLPELVTSISATRKGEYDIAIGNVIGSNIFNIGFVLCIPTIFFGNIIVDSFTYIDLLFLFLSIFVLYIFARHDYQIKKHEGIILLIMFVIYYSFVIFA